MNFRIWLEAEVTRRDPETRMDIPRAGTVSPYIGEMWERFQQIINHLSSLTKKDAQGKITRKYTSEQLSKKLQMILTIERFPPKEIEDIRLTIRAFKQSGFKPRIGSDGKVDLVQVSKPQIPIAKPYPFQLTGAL